LKISIRDAASEFSVKWPRPEILENIMKRVSKINSVTRDLTDKELNKITSAMGDRVRAQSIIVSKIIQENLKAEFASRRNNCQ
jgi:hypothetical protein